MPKQPSAKAMSARALLKASGADVLIWGVVLKQGGKSLPKLYWTPARDVAQSPTPARYQMTEALSLPTLFWQDLTNVLGLLVATSDGKAPGVEWVVPKPVEAFVLHGAAAATVEAPNVELQVDPKRTARQIPDPAFPAVVPAALYPTAAAAGRFFDRRRSTMIRTCGSPNTPRAVGSGRKPGNAYASHRRRSLADLAIRS